MKQLREKCEVCKESIYTETRWEQEATGNTDHQRQDRANGGKDSYRADLRGRFPGKLLWVQARQECPSGYG